MISKDLRKFITLEVKRTMLSSTGDIVEDDESDNLDEFSGAVAGYALPLGANPTDYGAPGTTSQRKRAFMTASKPYGIKKKSKKKSK